MEYLPHCPQYQDTLKPTVRQYTVVCSVVVSSVRTPNLRRPPTAEAHVCSGPPYAVRAAQCLNAAIPNGAGVPTCSCPSTAVVLELWGGSRQG